MKGLEWLSPDLHHSVFRNSPGAAAPGYSPPCCLGRLRKLNLYDHADPQISLMGLGIRLTVVRSVRASYSIGWYVFLVLLICCTFLIPTVQALEARWEYPAGREHIPRSHFFEDGSAVAAGTRDGHLVL